MIRCMEEALVWLSRAHDPDLLTFSEALRYAGEEMLLHIIQASPDDELAVREAKLRLRRKGLDYRPDPDRALALLGELRATPGSRKVRWACRELLEEAGYFPGELGYFRQDESQSEVHAATGSLGLGHVLRRQHLWTENWPRRKK